MTLITDHILDDNLNHNQCMNFSYKVDHNANLNINYLIENYQLS